MAAADAEGAAAPPWPDVQLAGSADRRAQRRRDRGGRAHPPGPRRGRNRRAGPAQSWSEGGGRAQRGEDHQAREGDRDPDRKPGPMRPVPGSREAARPIRSATRRKMIVFGADLVGSVRFGHRITVRRFRPTRAPDLMVHKNPGLGPPRRPEKTEPKPVRAPSGGVDTRGICTPAHAGEPALSVGAAPRIVYMADVGCGR